LELNCRLARVLLTFGLQPHGLDASRFLTSGLLPLRLELNCRPAHDLLSFGLQPGDLNESRFLSNGVFPLPFLRCVAAIWRRRVHVFRTPSTRRCRCHGS